MFKQIKQYRGIEVENREFVYGFLTMDPLSGEYVIQEVEDSGR